jgi:CHASE3 domain sensor protein
MLKKLKEKFITFSLSLLIVLVLLNALLIFYNRKVMIDNVIIQKQTSEVKMVWSSLFETNLRRMDMGLRGYGLVQNPQLLDPYYTGIRDLKIALNRIDSLLDVQGLDSLKQQFAMVKPKFLDYVDHSEQMRKSADEGNMQEFIRLLNLDPGYKLWRDFSPLYNYILPYQERLLAQANVRYENALDRNIIVQIVLVLVTIPTLVTVMYRIRRDDKDY